MRNSTCADFGGSRCQSVHRGVCIMNYIIVHVRTLAAYAVSPYIGVCILVRGTYVARYIPWSRCMNFGSACVLVHVKAVDRLHHFDDG